VNSIQTFIRDYFNSQNEEAKKHATQIDSAVTVAAAVPAPVNENVDAPPIQQQQQQQQQQQRDDVQTAEAQQQQSNQEALAVEKRKATAVFIRYFAKLIDANLLHNSPDLRRGRIIRSTTCAICNQPINQHSNERHGEMLVCNAHNCNSTAFVRCINALFVTQGTWRCNKQDVSHN
jgi:hypothetical protein